MKAYDYALRLEVIERYKRGERQCDISQKLGLSYSTIKAWVKRYRSEGQSGLKLKYGNCGGRPKVILSMKQAAIDLKRQHDSWGAGYIRLQLQRKYPGSYIPVARQLQRYFHQAGLVELTNKPPSSGRPSWAPHPLYRLQVDAKEQLQTADLNWCSYLTFTDEHSGAVLEALVFPPQVYPPSSLSGDL